MDTVKNRFWETDRGNDAVPTSPTTWRPLAAAVGGFDLDPAAGCEPVAIAKERFTKAEDGLSQSWYGTVWLNPPFSDKLAWIRKLVEEYRAGRVYRAIALVGGGTDPEWFQEWLSTADVVCFANDRDLFYNGGNNPPFASILGAWNPTDSVVDVFDDMGVVMKPTAVDPPNRTLADFPASGGDDDGDGGSGDDENKGGKRSAE